MEESAGQPSAMSLNEAVKFVEKQEQGARTQPTNMAWLASGTSFVVLAVVGTLIKQRRRGYAGLGNEV